MLELWMRKGLNVVLLSFDHLFKKICVIWNSFELHFDSMQISGLDKYALIPTLQNSYCFIHFFIINC